MSQPRTKSQAKANLYAVIAVFLFAYFESELGSIAKNVGIEAYIVFRLIFTGAFYFLVLWLFSLRRKGERLVFSPLNIDTILYARGFFTIIYLACLAAAFYGEKSQALTYPFFFLHPIWQVFAARVLNKKWPPIKRQIVPVAVILMGVLVFAASNPKYFSGTEVWWKQTLDAAPSYVPAILAGMGFAYTNELSNNISEKCNEHPYKFVNGVKVERIDGLRITAYTTYASILILPVALPVVTVILSTFGVNSLTLSIFQSEKLISHMGILSLACLIVALGTWSITEAFTRAKHTTQIAALDGLIVPLAAAMDYFHGRLPTNDPNFPFMVGALCLIVVGAVWSAFIAKAS